jgi:ERCC4-related helicase
MGLQTADFVEGQFVRSTSHLYRGYGIGRIQKIRGDSAKVEFNPSVFMRPPYRSENKILAIADLEAIDSPIDRACAGRWDDSLTFELRLTAARLLTGNTGGQLSNARTEILPHQIFTAHRVVASSSRRFLLADEVGLGKTIEAGMIWQALAQRGQASRTLIITPAGLTTQWQEEMQDKFGETFEIFGRDFQVVNPRIWDLKTTVIASLDTLKRPDHKRVLLENRRWNLIIFDEAHRLSALDYGSGKVEKTLNYKLAEELRARDYTDALLLLTATPHQGEENHSRFKNLLRLLEDNIDFSGLDNEPAGTSGSRAFTELVLRTPKKDVTDSDGRRVFKGRQTHRAPFKMYPDEAKFYRAVASYIRDGYNMLERVNDPMRRRAAGFLLTTFQKLNASSTAAIRAALQARLARLRGRLAATATRLNEEEDFNYDERFEGETQEASAARDDQRLTEEEVRSLDDLLSMVVHRDHKLDALLELIQHIDRESPRGAEEKVLIFTEYRETQRYLVAELESLYGRGSVVVIHGGMKLETDGDAERPVDVLLQPILGSGALAAPGTKRGAQRLFRDQDRVRFLVSTEAGGEGINLQFCHICINYDMPWNPMRVEQRVGRLYRLGQEKVVQVYNFFCQGTIEDTVQAYFEDRVHRAARAIAEVTGEDVEDLEGTLNGQLESEIDPGKIYQRAMVDGDLNRQSQKEIEAAVLRAKRAYEIATQSLFRDTSSYTFDRFQKEIATDVSMADVRRCVERFLGMQRRQIVNNPPFIQFLVPEVLRGPSMPERIERATFDREVAIRRGDAEFLTIGSRFVNDMLYYIGSYDFGGLTAIRRINSSEMTAARGFLFVFAVRERVRREDGDDCLFRLAPVFVTERMEIDQAVATLAMRESSGEKCVEPANVPDPRAALVVARQFLESSGGIWDWDEDVEFLGLSWLVTE